MPSKDKETKRRYSPRPATLPDPMPYLRGLLDLGPRATGSSGERRAARYVRGALEQLGLEVQEDRFSCNPRMFRPHMLVFLLVIAMAAVPALFNFMRVSFILATLGCLLARRFYLDLLDNRRSVLAKILPKSPCRNIIGKIRPRGIVKNRVVLLSHLDAAVCSPIFSDRMIRSLKTNIVIDRALFVTLASLYALTAFTGSLWLYYIAAGLSLYVVGSILVLLYSELFSPISPGANDNGSGVAAVLSMAEHLAQNPLENTEVWCVALGAEEPGAYGSKELWDAHAEDLRKSYIINLVSVAVGNPRYLINEGYTEEYACDPEMIRILERYATTHPSARLSPMAFKGWGGYTDCTHLLRNGCKAITLCATQPNDFIKNWHTLNDTLENLEPETYQQTLAIVNDLIMTLDEEVAAKREIPLNLQRTFVTPGYRIVDEKMIRQRGFDLNALLWPGFDQSADNVFQTAAYLKGHPNSVGTPGGFIFIDNDAGEPIAMVPYFVYYEVLDDTTCRPSVRRFARWLKARFLKYRLPILPGFRTLFIGQPLAQPDNKIFIRPGYTLHELVGSQAFLKNYRRALRILQLRHMALIVSHLSFEKNADHDLLFGSMGFKPFRSWPDMVLDFRKIRRRLKERLQEAMDQALDRHSQMQRKLTDLYESEANLFKDLEEDSLIRLKAQEKRLEVKAEEKQFILAAEAQNQIDDLTNSLKSGRYIDAMKKKNDVNRQQRDDAYPGYEQLPRRARDLLMKLVDLDGLAKDIAKDRNALVKDLETNKAKVKKIVEKSLCNKYSGELPLDLGERVEFFLAMRVDLSSHHEMPVGWVDITVSEVLKRLDDLASAWDLAQEQNFALEKKDELVREIEDKRLGLIQQLRPFLGLEVQDRLPALFQAERRTREIRKIEKQILEEKKLFKLGTDSMDQVKSASPEREKLKTALHNAIKRRDAAIQALGIQGGWESLSKSTRGNLKKLATLHLEIRRTDLKGALSAYEDAERQYRAFDETLDPSFEDYVESLGVSHRYAMKRNLERIRATEKDYPVEVISDPQRMLDLAYEMTRAYDEQYAATTVQWLKLTAEHFRFLAQLPGTELVVCWHLVDWTERRFAGFIVNLDGQFNHRMGIMPEYKFQNGRPEDNHLIYFRLTLKNIESNLRSGKPCMWIAQTTYEAKTRLGFEPHVLWAYRRPTRWFGFHILADAMYQRLLGQVLATEDLYEY